VSRRRRLAQRRCCRRMRAPATPAVTAGSAAAARAARAWHSVLQGWRLREAVAMHGRRQLQRTGAGQRHSLGHAAGGT